MASSAIPIAALEHDDFHESGSALFEEQPPQRLFDAAGALTSDQQQRYNGELDRLSRLGLEARVYIRDGAMSPDGATALAESLLRALEVESAAGMDDGVVFVIAIDREDREESVVAVTTGEHALPFRQLDAAALEEIALTRVLPAVQRGNINLATAYAVRDMIFYAEYTPPNPPPLTSLQQTANSIAQALGAALIQVAVLGYVLIGAIVNRRLTLAPASSGLVTYAIGLAIAAVVVGTVAIYGREATATWIALAAFIWAVVGVPLLIGFRHRRITTPADPASEPAPPLVLQEGAAVRG